MAVVQRGQRKKHRKRKTENRLIQAHYEWYQIHSHQIFYPQRIAVLSCQRLLPGAVFRSWSARKREKQFSSFKSHLRKLINRSSEKKTSHSEIHSLHSGRSVNSILIAPPAGRSARNETKASGADEPASSAPRIRRVSSSHPPWSVVPWFQPLQNEPLWRGCCVPWWVSNDRVMRGV